ncbi:MAG: CPBP family intramembrane glutamic endopeptidase [Tepidisphaerales bacterium]
MPVWPWLFYVPPGWRVYPPPPWWPPYPLPLQYATGAARGPIPPRIWTVYVAFLAALAGMLGGGAAIGVAFVIYSKATDQGMPDTARLTAFVLSFWGLTLVLLGNLVSTGSTSLIAAAFSPAPLRRRLAFAAPAIGWSSILALSIATTAVGHFLGMLVHLLGIEVSGSMIDLMQSVASFSAAEQWAMLVMIGLLVPITEELLFRGYIQTRLIERHGPLPGIFITSALFGLMHMNVYQSPATFFLGLVLGFAAWYGRSIIPAIAGHMVNNTIAIGLTFATNSESMPSRRFVVIWMFVSGTLVLLGIGWALLRGRRPVTLAT